MDLEKRLWKELDWTVLLILLGLGAFSYLGISGSAAGVDKANMQVIWYLSGYVVLFAMLLFDYRVFFTLAFPFYAVGIIMLIGVFWTTPINNTTSWYNLGPVLLQPAEPMKLFTILAVARLLAKQSENPDRFRYFYQLIPPAMMIGVPTLLILVQPDLGNATVYLGIAATMLVVGGIRKRHILYLLTLMGAFVGVMTYFYMYHRDTIFFKIFKPYQWDRIVYWLNPDLDAVGKGFQLKQALISIGSGQLMGKGVHTATQASFGWVPVGESDFIFTVVAEKTGFIGGGILMILYFFLVYRLIQIAMQVKDPFGSYVVSGVVGMLTFQIFENIGMTIQLMPITGITLPFISYGGSSLITNFMILAVVLNIGMRKKYGR
ncbi:UNVERIFIED_CONTAM: rod shape determining protein RodA [Brevibacillus sp. OAP136]